VKYIDEYANKHAGEKGFVIGGGPSICKTSFNFKRLDKEIVVGANKAYKVAKLDYLWFSDGNFWKTWSDEIRAVDCTKFYPAEYQQEEFGGVDDVQAVPVLVERTYRDSKDTVSDSESRRLLMVGGSGVCSLRIAAYLGLNPIYLVGMDFGNTGGKTHFHKDYEEMPWALATPDWYKRSLAIFKTTIKLLGKKDFTVISCSQKSPLNEMIPYKSLGSVAPKLKR